MEARIAELEIIEREKRRGWVKIEAARAWPAGERPSTKVFSLVGMSAENVRAVSGEVSQEVSNRVPCPLPPRAAVSPALSARLRH